MSLANHLFILRVATGRQLLEPIEVFYLPETDTLYPINSKAGCSSVKLVLLRRYLPDANLRFPDVHWADPSPLTGNRVQQIFFDTLGTYRQFCKGRTVVLVTRDPYARMHSAFRDHIRGKNVMYKTYRRLRKLLGFTPNISFESFVDRCSRIPERFGDRHFRPQSFYLPAPVRAAALETVTLDLPSFAGAVLLNRSAEELPAEVQRYLRTHPGFQRRYLRDLALYC